MAQIHPHQALAVVRRLAREAEKLDENLEAHGSKRARAELRGVRLTLARVQKTLQSEVNARRKLRELHEAQLQALKDQER
jgi:predicted TIM-barrel fold metal-dependent hydrolase